MMRLYNTEEIEMSMRKVAAGWAMAAMAMAAMVGSSHAFADDCVTGEEVKAWAIQNNPSASIEGPEKMPRELVKAFLEVSSFPGAAAVADIEVIRNTETEMTMVIPVSANGCSFDTPEANSLAPSAEEGVSLTAPKFVIERYLEQAKGKVNGQSS